MSTPFPRFSPPGPRTCSSPSPEPTCCSALPPSRVLSDESSPQRPPSPSPATPTTLAPELLPESRPSLGPNHYRTLFRPQECLWCRYHPGHCPPVPPECPRSLQTSDRRSRPRFGGPIHP